MLASFASRPLLLGAFSAALFLAIPLAASRNTDSATDDDVRVVNTPDVRVTSLSDDVAKALRSPRLTPSFLRAKKRYSFIWNPGEPPQTFVVVDVKDDGWVGIVVSDSPQPEFVTVADPRDVRWINVTRAFSIQEVY
jgi:hypothetical protein